MANGVMTTAQASDSNILVSLWQHIYQNIKVPYDIAALNAGLSQGVTLIRDGTYVPDALGLGIIDEDIDRDDFFSRVPAVGYEFDDSTARTPRATGLGDGANYEYRSVRFRAIPAIKLAVDNTTQSPDKVAHRLLKDAVWNAIGRRFKIDIVDGTQPLVNNKFPVVGYAEIKRPEFARQPSFKNQLIIDRRDFDLTFQLKLAVATSDGL
jgi:hypothetical protein